MGKKKCRASLQYRIPLVYYTYIYTYIYIPISPYIIQTKLFRRCMLCLNNTYRGFIFQLIADTIIIMSENSMGCSCQWLNKAKIKINSVGKNIYYFFICYFKNKKKCLLDQCTALYLTKHDLCCCVQASSNLSAQLLCDKNVFLSCSHVSFPFPATTIS